MGVVLKRFGAYGRVTLTGPGGLTLQWPAALVTAVFPMNMCSNICTFRLKMMTIMFLFSQCSTTRLIVKLKPCRINNILCISSVNFIRWKDHAHPAKCACAFVCKCVWAQNQETQKDKNKDTQTVCSRSPKICLF